MVARKHAHTPTTPSRSWRWIPARWLWVVVLLAAGCGDGIPTGFDDSEWLSRGQSGKPGTVDDLAVASVTQSSITLSWTEVEDGRGKPASYEVLNRLPGQGWGEAEAVRVGTCADPVGGNEVGETLVCSVEDLEAGVAYAFRARAFREAGNRRFYGTHSNSVTAETSDEEGEGETEDDGSDEPSGDEGEEEEGEEDDTDGEEETDGTAPDEPSEGGIWVDRQALMGYSTSGAAWDRLLSDAGSDPGGADISDMGSSHDVYTLAAALVCVRTSEYCSKARRGVVDAIGTEDGGRWLEVGRNLGGYVIAADLLSLRADGDPNSAGTRVQDWIEGWLTKKLPDNVTGELRGFRPFGGSANAMAQEGFAYTAVAAYLQDDWALERAWDAFRTYACDPSAPDREEIYLDKSVADGWAHDDENPCAINPAGTEKEVPSGLPGAGGVYRIDGALTGDMRRGGEFQWPPGYTQYPWVGLEGFVPAAQILHRAGYPAFEVSDRAVLRTHEYLSFLRRETGDERWFDGIRARQIVHLVNVTYGTSFPVNRVTGAGRTVGYTDWTHVTR